MRTFLTGIIATTHIWGRLENLISSLAPLPSNIYIAKEEPGHLGVNHDSRRLWLDYVKKMSRPLLSNYYLSNGRDPYDSCLRGQCDINSFQWLRPRELRKSELSLYYKHLSLLEVFMKSEQDFLLILEDDAIISETAVNSILDLINNSHFSLADLAGGCNLSLKGIMIPTYSSSDSKLEAYAVPWKSSRTTCCFIISKDFAYQCLFSDIHHYILPIDWMYTLILQQAQHNISLWVENLEIIHGSMQGLYNSSVQD